MVNGIRLRSDLLTTLGSLSVLLNATYVHVLEAISDQEMSGISGQAFITIDTSNYTDPTYGDFETLK